MTTREEHEATERNIDVFLEKAYKKYWEGVDDPELWSSAGFTAIEARQALSLPVGHSDRPDEQSLNVLASLQLPVYISNAQFAELLFGI